MFGHKLQPFGIDMPRFNDSPCFLRTASRVDGNSNEQFDNCEAARFRLRLLRRFHDCVSFAKRFHEFADENEFARPRIRGELTGRPSTWNAPKVTQSSSTANISVYLDLTSSNSVTASALVHTPILPRPLNWSSSASSRS